MTALIDSQFTHFSGRAIDWYCTVCDQEMDIDTRAQHMSAPPHAAYRHTMDLKPGSTGVHVGGEDGGVKLESESNHSMSWTCIICDVSLNIFHREDHLNEKSHARKARTHVTDQVLPTPEPPRATWECPVCEESMHVFYQAEHVAGKPYFRRLHEKGLEEDLTLAHTRDMYSSVEELVEKDDDRHGAVVDNAGEGTGAADDQQDVDIRTSLAIPPELGRVGFSYPNPSDDNISDRQSLQNKIPQDTERHAGHDAQHLSPITQPHSTSLQPVAAIPISSKSPAAIWMFYCDVCEKGFRKREKMDKHLITTRHLTNVVAGRFYCEVCERDVDMKDKKRHRGPAWKCVACNVSMHTMWKDGHLPKEGHKKNQLLLEERTRAAAVSG